MAAGTGIISKFVQFGNDMVNLEARINLINNGLETMEQIQNKIFAAAQRSRSEYGQMGDAVTKLGLQAGNAFNNDINQIIKFQELLGKTMIIAGTSASGAESVRYNLTQALSSGVLRGQDLANTPQIARYIEKSMGAATGSIKDLAESGAITASVVKKAMFEAANDIESQFTGMQDTFTGKMTVMENEAAFAARNMVKSFNKWFLAVFYSTSSAKVYQITEAELTQLEQKNLLIAALSLQELQKEELQGRRFS